MPAISVAPQAATAGRNTCSIQPNTARADMRAKFDALVAPRLGPRSESLFGLARAFGHGALDEIRTMLARL